MMSAEPMNCAELVELVTEYLEESLDPELRARFDMHLLACDGCANYLQQFRNTVQTLGRVHGEALDPEFRDKLLQAFRGWR